MTTPLDVLVIEVTSDDAKFRKGLEGAKNYAKAWAASMKPSMAGLASAFTAVATTVAAVGAAAGAAAIGGITLLVKRSLEANDAMAKLSDKTGIQIEALYGWKVAAELVGVEIGSVTKMSQILQRQISEAATGNLEAMESFQRLGVSVGELRNMSAEEAFGKVTDALNNMGNQADRTATGMVVFGRGFVENINFLRLGSKGLEDAAKRAVELGVSLNRVEVAKLEAVNDSFTELGLVISGLGNSFALALSPYILQATTDMVNLGIKTGGFRDEVRSAIDGAMGSLGWLLDGIRLVQQGWLYGKAAFLEFSSLVNNGLSGIAKVIHGTGVVVENFFAALLQTAEMGQSGLEVMWVAIKVAAAKAFAFMVDGLKTVLFSIADVAHYTSEALGKSFEDAALKAGAAAKSFSATYDKEFESVKFASAQAADEAAEAWVKLANSDATNTWSNKLSENADTAQEHASAAWVELTTLMQQPMPSEGIDAWKTKALASIQEVAEAVAASVQPKQSGSGETKSEGGSDEFVNQMFNIGTLETEHKAYAELLAEKYVELAQQRRDFQANSDMEIQTMKEGHLLAIEQQEADSAARTAALWESGMKGKLQVAGSILGQLSALQGSHSRKQFEVWKAAAIGETIVNTYSAAMGAYNAMAAIPYIGPALGVAAAAAAVAAGLANVQKISSTSFGGGGGGGAPTAPQLGNGTGANAPTGGDSGGVYGGGQGGPARQVTIQLQGDSMYSGAQVARLIGAINEQLGDGAVLGSLRAT